MPQKYNLKPRLQKFGERGAMAVVDKLKQLHIMVTWMAMDPSKIKHEDRVRVLLSLLFLKEKCTRIIKGRACINRAPQRAYIPKEEAALPTVLTKSTFITAAIAANKHRLVEVLRYTQCLCEYRCGQRRTDGAEGRVGGDDGTNSTTGIQEIHHGG